MEYTSGMIGRAFFVRFDHGDDIVSGLEAISKKENLSLATVNILGAIEKADLVCGPKKPLGPPDPNLVKFDDGREVLGFGTITSYKGKTRVHLHGSFGNKESALTGCLRKGNQTYITMEAVITEITGISLTRKLDKWSGIDLVFFDPPSREIGENDNR